MCTWFLKERFECRRPVDAFVSIDRGYHIKVVCFSPLFYRPPLSPGEATFYDLTYRHYLQSAGGKAKCAFAFSERGEIKL